MVAALGLIVMTNRNGVWLSYIRWDKLGGCEFAESRTKNGSMSKCSITQSSSCMDSRSRSFTLTKLTNYPQTKRFVAVFRLMSVLGLDVAISMKFRPFHTMSMLKHGFAFDRSMCRNESSRHNREGHENKE